jgi:hypothetical protein
MRLQGMTEPRCAGCYPSIRRLLGLLALDAARKLGCLDRYRMHRHVADELVNESLPPLPPLLQPGALDAMRKFHDGNHRKADLGFSVASLDLFEDLPHGVVLPLSGDNHAGVED